MVHLFKIEATYANGDKLLIDWYAPLNNKSNV